VSTIAFHYVSYLLDVPVLADNRIINSLLSVIAHTMGSLLARFWERNVVMLIMGIFVLWALIWHPDVEFTYYRSIKPFPNQALARVFFYTAGIVLTLGGVLTRPLISTGRTLVNCSHKAQYRLTRIGPRSSRKLDEVLLCA
jgi:hypothetical protein